MASASLSNDIPEVGLTVVYEPQSTSPNLDVVFVHGFTGSPYKTWTNTDVDTSNEPPSKARKISFGFRSRRQAVFWPRDLLPKTLPRARVLTYGYDTHIRHRIFGPVVSDQTVYDIAKELLVSLESFRREEPSRPLLFICHSLGGIVTKEMLRQACHNQLDKQDLCESTVGIIFFGTPHQGADPRKLLHRTLETVVRLAGMSVNDNITRTLLPDSERLRQLIDEFNPIAQRHKWIIYSFQEAHRIKLLGDNRVVDSMSSCLGLGQPLETKQFINSNHMDMCRFAAIDDPEYEKVVSALHKITAGLATRSQKRNCGTRPLNEEEHQTLLDSLRFDQIDHRLQSVKAAYAATCRWFMRHPAYLDWQDPKKASEHHGFLWVMGKPGAGKSTLMKFALADHRRRHRGESIVSFFFNARGAELERTTAGMYRSLIVQLLELFPRLRCAFDNAGLMPWNAVGNNHWSIELLKEVFGQLVQGLEQSERVTCFIDALDECSRDEIRDMVEFFESLVADEAVDQGSFCVVFSSRHYPEITTTKAVSLVLETQEEHSIDIKKYVEGRLTIELRDDARDQIVQRIEEKASGVFMWVVLVVDILNKAHLDGRPPSYFRKKLEELPADLHELFRDMLIRDQSDKHELLLCLQWIFFARRPLSPEELYCGIIAGTEPQMLGECDAVNVGVDRFILNTSKGLAEVIELEKGKRIAQFIHESVRDFLLKEGGLRTLWPDLGDDFLTRTHDALKDCCTTYFNLNLPKPETDPFLQYVTESILWHADNAAAGGIFQGKFLEEFPRERWVMLHNSFEKRKIRHYSMGVTLTYILAARDLSALVKTHSVASGRSGLEVEGERFLTPLFAARAAKSQKAALAILQEASRNHQPMPELQDIFQQLAREPPTSSCWNSFFKRRKKRQSELGPLWYVALAAGDANLSAYLFFLDRLARPVDDLEKGYNGGWTPLDLAAESGAITMAKLLLKNGAIFEPRTGRGWTPLHRAASTGKHEFVDFLLKAGATIEAENSEGATALCLASHQRHYDVVQLLITAGANFDVKDENDRTPLIMAIDSPQAGNTGADIVKLLLEVGANTEATDRGGKTPLHWAATSGDVEITKLLLKAGATVDARRGISRTPLHIASSYAHPEVVQLLIEAGADAEVEDSYGWRPLNSVARSFRYGTSAGAHRYSATVRVLLEAGARVDTKSSCGWSALHGAAVGGLYEAVVELLQAGAPVDGKDYNGDTPLHEAAFGGNPAVVLRLIQAGGFLEAKNNLGDTPLLRAAVGRGQRKAVQALLDAGADKEARNLEGATALVKAASKPDPGVVMALFRAGLDIEAKDHRGRTPLMWAAKCFNFKVVESLVEAGANVSATDKDGWTALDWAEKSDAKPWEESRKATTVRFLEKVSQDRAQIVVSLP